MSQSKPAAPRFVILFWTIHSSLPNTQPVSTEELREDGDVTAIATYSFSNAQQRTVRFQPFSPT